MKYLKKSIGFCAFGIVLACLTGCSIGHKSTTPLNNLNLSLIDGDETIFNLVPIAIIGSGPAGLAAGMYGARLGPKTVIIAGPEPGGQLTKTSEVENWPGVIPGIGADIMEDAEQQARDSGAIITYNTVESVDFSQWPYELELDDGSVINALTVIICTGAQPRLLDIPGESEFWGTGVSGCAICDAPFFKDKRVVVVGGGDSAAEQAMQLAVHAKEVTMFVRKPHMRASAAMQTHLEDYDNITVVYDTVVEEIIGDAQVESIHIRTNNKVSAFQTDGVFVAIGHEPNSKLFEGQVELDELGYVRTDLRSQETSIKGVYAAGDIDDYRYRQAGTAAGEGIKAGIDAYTFLAELGYSPSFEQRNSKKMFDLIDLERQELEIVRSVVDLEQLIEESQILVLDCYTQGCISCKHLEPTLEILAAEYANQVTFLKIDVAKNPDIAKKYGVTTVPSLVLIKNGIAHEVIQPEEPLNKAILEQSIEALL